MFFYKEKDWLDIYIYLRVIFFLYLNFITTKDYLIALLFLSIHSSLKLPFPIKLFYFNTTNPIHSYK